MEIQTLDNSLIEGDQTVFLAFSSFINPSNPEKTYSFGVSTLYYATDPLSVVQSKTGLFTHSFI